jgi:hypothetical protein
MLTPSQCKRHRKCGLQLTQTNKNTHVMKNIFRTITALAIIALAFASCTSNRGMAYNSHLKNKGTCMISGDGCAWSKR